MRRGTIFVVLGLPDGVTVCLFDLDGVLTDTAVLHKAAWKEAFDAYLQDHGGGEFTDEDYDDHVDGKPREDGVRDFLTSRGLDPSEKDVTQVADHKNDLLLKKIHDDGVKVFEGSRRYLEEAAAAGLRRIVVSSSANTKDVLHVTGLEDLVEGRVDGVTIKKEHLEGKPAPDSFLAGAQLAHATPDQCAVFEDALAGVEAGHRGGFAAVVGVDRHRDDAHAQALRSHGATVVVRDLADLLDPAGQQ